MPIVANLSGFTVKFKRLAYGWSCAVVSLTQAMQCDAAFKIPIPIGSDLWKYGEIISASDPAGYSEFCYRIRVLV